ncbi:energy transducer TonB [Undibacterium sp. CY18W]|uniref:Energy transducer TonB n=1 Tax=Undibacterium hunanense TaxID=2762292 RepID=A0ABR6ZZK0_9BURK|nr:energy transducer TonB [Undibacterium hunanense]MBC3921083.1 energy transducer TonB [Undibacterium hunanense]
MSTLTLSHHNGPAPIPRSRIVSFTGIVLAHLGLFYALEHGLISHAVQILPKEVILTMIQPHVSKPEQPPAPIPTKKLTTLPPPIPLVPQITPVVDIPVEQHQITVQPSPQIPQPVAAVAAKAEPSTSMAPPAAPKQISAVEYLRPPQADYPPMSRRMGEEGKVTLRILVNEKGVAEKVDIQKSSGSNRLDEAAKTAILRAIFKPYLEDGKALTVIATATISFTLNS